MKGTSPASVTDSGEANGTGTAEEPLTISVQEAILMAMENNRSLIVERMNPDIMRTYEEEETSIFDPVLGAEVSPRRTVADRLSRAGSSTESQIVDSVTGSLSMGKFFSAIHLLPIVSESVSLRRFCREGMYVLIWPVYIRPE